jgi:hypothetical protein
MKVISIAAIIILILVAEAFIFRQTPPDLLPHSNSLGLSQVLKCLNASASTHHHVPLSGKILSSTVYSLRDANGILGEAYDISSPMFTPKQLWDLQKVVLDNYLYPANVKQAESINSSLLAPNVQGRVDVTTTLAGLVILHIGFGLPMYKIIL